MPRFLLATLLLLCGVLIVAELRYRGAPLVARDGDARQFSAERARDAIAPFANAPHPTGTPALAAARAHAMRRLRASGYEPVERTTLACGRYGVCARVSQVSARSSGLASTGAVLLLAHLDAVGAGPGASDDGAGVAAVLEIARALAAHGPRRNDVLLLLVEGEELGLLGAEAFVRDDPAARDVKVVINVEARGSRGSASLFQISRDSRFVVDAAASMRRPVGSSLFAAVYERMPNDTDLSAFLARGYAGMNFAFSDGVEHYHTAHDDLAHQDPRSVQHLGDSALASVLTLSAIDLRAPARGEMVFFDVLALAIVRYPAGWAFPLSLGALAAVSVLSALALRARRVTLGELSLGVASWLLAVVLAAALGVAIYAAVRAAGALPVPWIARPAALLFALIGAALTAILSAVAVGRRMLRLESFALAIALVHTLSSVALSRLLPGGSYLLLVPVAVACLAAPFSARLGVSALGLGQVVVWIVVVRSLYPALGAMAAPAVALTASLMLLPLAPLLLESPRVAVRARPLALSLAVFSAVATLIAMLSRPFSAAVPQRVNVVVAREEGRPARAAVDPTWGGQPWGAPPAAMVAALGGQRSEPIVPWRDDSSPIGAADSDAPAPEVTIVTAEPRRLHLRIKSRRDAPTLYVIAPASSNLVHVEVAGAVGAPTFFRRSIAPGARGIRFDGLDEVDVTLMFGGLAGELFVADATYGAPAAAAVIAARPAEAVPTQDGDVTIAYRRVRP